jgi:hypothetical protein
VRYCIGLFIVVAGIITFAANSHAAEQRKEYCEDKAYYPPPGIDVLCSKTYSFIGKCDGTDQNEKWIIAGTGITDKSIHSITGQRGVEGPWLKPNFPEPGVLVRGFELTKAAGGPHSHFELGLGTVPDAFMWMGSEQNHVLFWAPQNTGLPWPSHAYATQPVFPARAEMLGIHGSCTGGDEVVLYLSIYYTPWPDGLPGPYNNTN